MYCHLDGSLLPCLQLNNLSWTRLRSDNVTQVCSAVWCRWAKWVPEVIQQVRGRAGWLHSPWCSLLFLPYERTLVVCFINFFLLSVYQSKFFKSIIHRTSLKICYSSVKCVSLEQYYKREEFFCIYSKGVVIYIWKNILRNLLLLYFIFF